jgi:hypothetical protein
MTRLIWGERAPFFDRGVDRGVLYLNDTAVPWNGLVSVEEKQTGATNADHYFDGSRLHISQEIGDFEARVSAYTYPDVFAEYNGYSERDIYRSFGLSYRTDYGDGYRLHLVYNATVHDDQRAWSTQSANVQISTFDWDIYGTPVPVPGSSPTSRIIMETPRDPDILRQLEEVLYGTETTDPRLPPPEELLDIYEAATLLRITYNGDGSYTASGPDDMVRDLGDGRFEIDAPTAFLMRNGAFIVNSY